MLANTIESLPPMEAITAATAKTTTTETKPQQETIKSEKKSGIILPIRETLKTTKASEARATLSQKALSSEESRVVSALRFASDGHSRSQDENDTAEKRRRDVDELRAHDHCFSQIPVIYSEPVNNKNTHGSNGNMTFMNFTMALNPSRLKFRKSHTCGSLFANCRCSENVEIVPTPMIHNVIPTTQALTEQRQPLTALPLSPQLSLSPSNADLSTASSGLGVSLRSNSATTASPKWLSEEGSFSFSTNTINAPIQHDDDNGDLKDSFSRSAWSSLVGEPQAKSSYGTASGGLTNRNLKTIRVSPPTSHGLVIPSGGSLDSSVLPTRDGSAQPTPRRLFQSYSHPDTDFLFTNENKRPSREQPNENNRLSREQLTIPAKQKNVLRSTGDAIITSRDGQIACRHPKRSSSPSIGDYQTLDIAVHPDLLVKVSPRHSPLSLSWTEQRKLVSVTASPHNTETRSTKQRRHWLQRSKEVYSEGSELTSEEHSSNPKTPESLSNLVTTRESEHLKANKLSSPVTDVTVQNNTIFPTKDVEENLTAAQRYFAESGILGPISPSNNLIRKTSKILQDANVIEKIRKTSQVLRGSNAIAITPVKLGATNSDTETLVGTTTLSRSNTPVYVEETTSTSPKNLKSKKSLKLSISPQDMATTCGFSPNLTSQSSSNLDDHEALIKSLQGEMASLRDVIKSRDAEILKLRREIHKLKSVLQQTTQHIPIVCDGLLASPTDIKSSRTFVPNSKCLSESSQIIKCSFCQQKNEREGSTSGSNGSISTDSTTSEYFTCNSTASNPTISNICNGGGSGSTNNKNRSNESGDRPTLRHSICTAAAATAVNPIASHSASCALAALKDSNCSTAASAESPSVVQSIPATYSNTITKPKALTMLTAPVLKKQGVSGESCEISMQQSINEPIKKFEKDFSSKQLIKDAIMDNDFLKNIDASQVRELVESMYPLSVERGKFVIREGEAGAHLYVSAVGEFEVMKNDIVLGTMGSGKAFGELAILYNCTRTASVRALSDARLWVLDRRVFQQIMMRTGMQRIENSMNFLKSVPLLRNLSEEVLAKIADVLEVEFYPAGTYIIRQGANGDTFFLVSQGAVKVTQKLGPNCIENEIRILQRGDYFGEQALINEDKRTANIIALAPGVECLTLDRESFTHLIGDLSELKEKDYGDDNRMLALKCVESREMFGANLKQEFPDMKLSDLELVETLGIGGFGRVELVKVYKDNRVDIFALKCLKKRHIIETKQEEHIFSERAIMLTCKTPFICRLFRTFRDEKYVYMLLEACMGGEIWTMLRDCGCFEENATQFIIGCVLQAFEYLHSRGIIYRDLKPENLMMDERGYVKLVDFGFAKYIGNTCKTWTFCGTPEYVAPEIILNKGHDRAVDYWALGILIHELLNGTPPFTSADPMKTYNIILKGIDMIDFPKHMTRSSVQLIKKLCRDVPAERLGYQKGGIQDIKKHKWFLGFDWDGLQNQSLIPPFARPLAHPVDTCYFDRFPCDPDEPPDEMSGWDVDF